MILVGTPLPPSHRSPPLPRFILYLSLFITISAHCSPVNFGADHLKPSILFCSYVPTAVLLIATSNLLAMINCCLSSSVHLSIITGCSFLLCIYLHLLIFCFIPIELIFCTPYQARTASSSWTSQPLQSVPYVSMTAFPFSSIAAVCLNFFFNISRQCLPFSWMIISAAKKCCLMLDDYQPWWWVSYLQLAPS